MASASQVVAAAALLVGGCGSEVSGVVRDAASERPIPGALVELHTIGWGTRNNQIVWDATKVTRVAADRDGRFSFSSDGGSALRVVAPGHGTVRTSLCPRSPMIVRVGGDYARLEADRQLLFEQAAGRSESYVASLDGTALRASGSAFSDGYDLAVESEGGVLFVPGTGAIPHPPPLPYDQAAELDVRADCGWLFIGDGASAIAAIKIGPIAWQQAPGEPRTWMMLYSPVKA